MGEQTDQPARCVVWTEAGSSLPPELAGALRKRGVHPEHTPSPHLALSALCLAHRAGVRSALVLAGVHDPARVLSTVERFAPSAVVWIFAPGANPPLRPLVLSSVGSSGSRQMGVPPSKNNGDGSSPNPSNGVVGGVVEMKRLIPNPGLKPSALSADPTGRGLPISARDILEDAELEMLLAGEKGMEETPR